MLTYINCKKKYQGKEKISISFPFCFLPTRKGKMEATHKSPLISLRPFYFCVSYFWLLLLLLLLKLDFFVWCCHPPTRLYQQFYFF